MSLWIEKKYTAFLGAKLGLFKQKSEYLWNFRCPICSDSKKDKTKTRGYLYRKGANLVFHCHNCHTTMAFSKFLRKLDPVMSQEFEMETFAEKRTGSSYDAPILAPPRELLVQDVPLPSIASLPFDHFARRYCMARKLPEKFLTDIYYTSCFKSFVDEMLPGHDKEFPVANKRLIIPFRDENKFLQGFQGRALTEDKVKYITISLSEKSRKVYGLDRYDPSQLIYVVEGPIDSMFLPNSLATMDSALYRIAEVVGSDKQYVFVFDNERRNPQIVSAIRKTIQLGYAVCIYPRELMEKDINEMIIKGKSQEEIHRLIKNRTFEDLRANLELGKWIS